MKTKKTNKSTTKSAIVGMNMYLDAAMSEARAIRSSLSYLEKKIRRRKREVAFVEKALKLSGKLIKD
jgi:hypothetical protein